METQDQPDSRQRGCNATPFTMFTPKQENTQSFNLQKCLKNEFRKIIRSLVPVVGKFLSRSSSKIGHSCTTHEHETTENTKPKTCDSNVRKWPSGAYLKQKLGSPSEALHRVELPEMRCCQNLPFDHKELQNNSDLQKEAEPQIGILRDK